MLYIILPPLYLMEPFSLSIYKALYSIIMSDNPCFTVFV